MDIASSAAAQERWPGSVASPPDECALFCLPYAGGDSTAFWHWRRALPAAVRVQFVELPGRDGRTADPGPISPPDVAAVIAARAPTPYAIYGHSMGARLAFETVRELARLGAPRPLRLYVGAAHPPHLPEPLARLAHATEDDFVDQLIMRAGAPAALREDPDVRAALLPALRADLDWLKRYRYRHDTALTVPVVAFAGTCDREVAADVMLGWARHTSGSFRLHTVAGDHLFIRTASDAVTSLIASDLGTAMAAHDGDGGPPALPLPAPDEVHVWRVELDRLPGACSATGELSAAETASAAAAPDQVERRRYIGRCVVVRRLLRRYGADLRYRLSHSGGTVLVAFSRTGEVGVDVERLRPVADFDAFCDRALTPAERAEVAAEPEEAQLHAGLRFWTAKRALRMATATGAAAAAGAGWRVRHLELDGVVGALATRQDDWRLRFETIVESPR
ncbi:MAG: 4'-phosphopantetheinyl transferase superfamily protein [Micromonosporaceae bacterium]|nr:4'-phosphopantetheinyl transferase superfamily protein [Micromonosporaceae bacterium]